MKIGPRKWEIGRFEAKWFSKCPHRIEALSSAWPQLRIQLERQDGIEIHSWELIIRSHRGRGRRGDIICSKVCDKSKAEVKISTRRLNKASRVVHARDAHVAARRLVHLWYPGIAAITLKGVGPVLSVGGSTFWGNRNPIDFRSVLMRSVDCWLMIGSKGSHSQPWADLQQKRASQTSKNGGLSTVGSFKLVLKPSNEEIF